MLVPNDLEKKKKVICNDQDVTVMIKVIIGENINNHSTLALGPLIYK